MKKKRTRLSADERRKQIVSVATELFSKKGFHGTKTREISQAGNVSEAMIFRLFETKEKLYEAIVESQLDEYVVSFPSDQAAKKDDYGVFYSIARSILLEGENTTLYRLLMYSVLEEGKLADIYLKNPKLPIKDFINYIQQRIEDNAFKQMNSCLVASSFVGACVHYIIGKRMLEITCGVDEISAAVTLLFLQGLQK